MTRHKFVPIANDLEKGSQGSLAKSAHWDSSNLGSEQYCTWPYRLRNPLV